MYFLNLFLFFLGAFLFWKVSKLIGQIRGLEEKLSLHDGYIKDLLNRQVPQEGKEPVLKSDVKQAAASVPETAKPAPEPKAKPKPAATGAWDEYVSAKTAAPEEAASVENGAFEAAEENLSTRWLMWLGGITLALGGGFLVKYSIDSELLSPTARLWLGSLLGLGLALFGERVRQKRGDISWLEGRPDYLPGSISAAGLFILFAAIYSGYAFHELMPPLAAFVLLALVSVVAMGLALLQGAFVAYLGLVGAMAAPALVSTGNANAWTLFPYLLFVVASALYVARQKAWAGVVATSLSLASLWVVLWIFTAWHVGDALPVGLYILILLGLNIAMLRGASPDRSDDASLWGSFPTHPVSMMSDTVAFLCLFLLTSIVRLEHYDFVSLFLFGAAIIGLAYAASRDAEHDLSLLVGLATSLFLLLTWHLPDLFNMQSYMPAREAMHFAFSPIGHPKLGEFATVATLFAAAVGFGVFFTLPQLMRKATWATVGAGYPLLVLVIAYGRLNDFEVGLPYAALALFIAFLFTGAVVALNNREEAGMRLPIAAYAAGASFALSLALAMTLRDAWLSLSLALEVLALGYLWRNFISVDALRSVALLFASIVLVRLFLNTSVLDYGEGEPLPLINWLFYAYGLTAAVFYGAARLFQEEEEEDHLVSILKAGCILLTIAFVTLEIRVLSGKTGALDGKPTSLEMALQTINWSAATTLLLWLECRQLQNGMVYQVLRRFMTVTSFLAIVFGGAGLNNIFFGQDDLGKWPLVNLQSLQLFVPAILLLVKTWLATKAGKRTSQKLYGVAALLLFFFWLSAEVRHFFHPRGDSMAASEWEVYAYSLIWLVYAVALLFAGIRMELRKLRMAGLGFLGVVVFKVFLFDMAQLEGVARALSFMGLGGTLIGLGYLYQRLKTQDGVAQG